MKRSFVTAIVSIFATLSPPAMAQVDPELSPAEAQEIAYEAYVFGASYVDNYRVYLQSIFNPDFAVPMTPNSFVHLRDLVGPELSDTPNNDALFSYTILDLRREPVVISVPEVEDDRLYMLQMGEVNTNTLPYISSISTGTAAGDYAIVGPDFVGFLPADRLDGIISTRGQLVAITGRTAVDGAADLPAVHAIQDAYTITPLSAFLGTEPPAGPGPLGPLPWDEERAAGIGIMDYMAQFFAWQLPTLEEVPMFARFARIGLVPGKPFSTEGISPEIISAIEEGLSAARAEVDDVASNALHPDAGGGWQFGTENIAQVGTNYVLRSAVSAETIYPNAPDHAMYGAGRIDADGNTLTGANNYTLTFADGALPPVDGFWSLTIYDSATTAMVPNALERYSIGDRTEGLVYGEKSELTICLQVSEPQNPVCNWLPAPEGQFYLILRLYAPTEQAASGDWTPPPITRQ
ncbi:MAG: DUF1214 domain-containing protein [Dinoroseobacter sp.]|nr:DUF1214 domain-containing protein [Dinoroseobacter sp.]